MGDAVSFAGASADKAIDAENVMSHRCPECHVNWWPYQARGGVCPVCGGGVVASVEDADPDSVAMYRATLAQRDADERRARFRPISTPDDQASLAAFMAEFGDRLR